MSSCSPTRRRGQASELALHVGRLVRICVRSPEILMRHTGRTSEQMTADLECEAALDPQQAAE
ncbi:ATP-dependent Clp protease proteolytic subunit [Streptomyces sp. NPDC017890]|uniref:ATP-dependent Clp protease proteolytic subunit n=1 Tax=Streptomyces sp. NPDC017890 TaxID=3365015 RepID=UPI00379A072C